MEMFLRDTFMSVAGNFDGLTKQLPKRFSQIYLSYGQNEIIVNETKDHPPTQVKIGGSLFPNEESMMIGFVLLFAHR